MAAEMVSISKMCIKNTHLKSKLKFDGLMECFVFLVVNTRV